MAAKAAGRPKRPDGQNGSREAIAGLDKPKGAPGVRGWKRRRRQRTRRWSKALRPRLRTNGLRTKPRRPRRNASAGDRNGEPARETAMGSGWETVCSWFGEKGREGKARGEGIDRCRSRLCRREQQREPVMLELVVLEAAVAGNGGDRACDAGPWRRTCAGSVAVGGGKASKGRSSAVGNLVSRRGETWRTPGSGAGRNKPARSRRSKPSRWCETTRTEREEDWLSFSEGRRGDAHPGRRTPRLGTMEGRSLDNPRRGCPAGPGRTAWIET
jgi:hypothetical protein